MYIQLDIYRKFSGLQSVRVIAEPGERIDKMYLCCMCNHKMLFCRDVVDHEKITGHKCDDAIIILWLDDAVHLDNF